MTLRKFANLIQTESSWDKLLAETNNLKGKVFQNLNFIDKKEHLKLIITTTILFSLIPILFFWIDYLNLWKKQN